jgi:hypothetical protein
MLPVAASPTGSSLDGWPWEPQAACQSLGLSQMGMMDNEAQGLGPEIEFCGMLPTSGQFGYMCKPAGKPLDFVICFAGHPRRPSTAADCRSR